MSTPEINVSIGGIMYGSSELAPGDLVDLTSVSEDDSDTRSGRGASADPQVGANIMAGQFDFLNPSFVTAEHVGQEDLQGSALQPQCKQETRAASLPTETLAQGGDGKCNAESGHQHSEKRLREEDMQCMICFEAWSNSGEHRIVSLACGHVFGNSCISKWLGEKKFCPSCNKAARRSQIRPIFVSNLVAMDTAERDHAVAEMMKEREHRRHAESQRVRAEQEVMKAMRTNEGLQSEIKRLKTQMTQLRQQAAAARHQVPTPHEDAHRPVISQDAPSRGCSQGEGKVDSGFRYLKSFQVQGARVIDFSLQTASALISSSSNGTTHTLTKINYLSGAQESMPTMHSKLIRDCRVDPVEGQFVLTCSIDKSARVTNIASNNCVQEYQVDKELWSCAWHPTDQNIFFCGGAQNSLFLFDLRDTSAPKLSLRGVRPQPTHSLVVVPSLNDSVDVIGGTMGGLCVWHFPSLAAPSESVVCRPLALPGRLCTCVCSNADASVLLASFRFGEQGADGPVHIQFKVSREKVVADAADACEVVATIGGHCSAKVLSRSAIIEPKADKAACNGESKILVASGDESTMQSWLWDATSTEAQPHKLYPHPGPVLDTQARGHLLGSLSESRVYLYEMKAEA